MDSKFLYVAPLRMIQRWRVRCQLRPRLFFAAFLLFRYNTHFLRSDSAADIHDIQFKRTKSRVDPG